jgi:hypothetical protein
MLVKAGGGVMMIARASSSLAEGGQSTAGEGAGSFRAVHETHRQPRCVGEEEGCKQTSRRTTRGNRTRKGGGAWPPHEHHHVPCACCNHVHAVHAGCCRREGRGGVGCVVWAGRRRRERVLRVMMMRRPGLAGQSKANQSKQHRGKTAQWGRHNSRVHTRLAGHKEGGREFKKTREHRFFSSPSSLLLLQGGNVKTLFSRGPKHE